MIRCKQIIIVGGFGELRGRMRGIATRALRMMAREYQRRYMPRHFHFSAERRYGYQERSPGTRRRKRRRAKPALVESGRSQRIAKNVYRITGRYPRVNVRWVMPHYFGMRPTRRGLPALGLEMTTVLDSEANELIRPVVRRTNRELNRAAGRRIIRL